MTLEECAALLAPIALACRADMDGPTFRAYHRVLKDVPAALGELALEALMPSGLRFMPSAPEILLASEKTRRQLLAVHKYVGCAECEGHIGFRDVRTANGQGTVEPCPCKARHKATLERYGLATRLALLPGEAGVGENEQTYPTIDQLPSGIRQRLQTIADRKLLR